ncbi:MAG TPA: S41 family peptidase [Candidatus Kaiserbacteria bacterium]|nr:S41 family peptidase [Candidatus Kaiserbacteria bacterium]
MSNISHPSSSMVRRAISYAVIVAVSFVAGAVFMRPANASMDTLVAHLPLIGNSLDATPDNSANFTDFWQVWNVLKTKFVETHASSTIPNTKRKLWGAIAGLTASYGDPYTIFMPPSDAKVFKQDITGSFGGVGMEIGVKNGILTVIAPLKGTPAALAGIRSGDQIVSIDKHSTEGMSADKAVKLIRGKRGTNVVFTVMRKGKVLNIKVMRKVIQVPEIDYGLNHKTGTYHIALYTFTANSADLFDKAFTAFKKSGSRKLIIDMRGNPGGYLDAAVDIVSHFLPKGEVIVTEDYEGKKANIVHRSIGYNDLPKGTKVAVLINQGSASAAEILSGALQDHHVATLIGTRSFGKGSVQELINIDGGSLKVTVARWLTPSGRSISDGGLTPDIKVGRTQADFIAGRDPQMSRAVQFLLTGK